MDRYLVYGCIGHRHTVVVRHALLEGATARIVFVPEDATAYAASVDTAVKIPP